MLPSGLLTKFAGRLLSYLDVSSKNASGTEIRKSGSAIGAVDAVLLRWKYGGGDWSDDEAREELWRA